MPVFRHTSASLLLMKLLWEDNKDEEMLLQLVWLVPNEQLPVVQAPLCIALKQRKRVSLKLL